MTTSTLDIKLLKKPIVECQNCNAFYHIDVLDNNNYYLDGDPL